MKKQANHTPGPWFKSEVLGCDHLVFASEAQDSVRIANCDSRGQPMSSRQVLANARLIAAAPEMAEAMKEYCLGTKRYSAKENQYWADVFKPILKKAGVLDKEE